MDKHNKLKIKPEFSNLCNWDFYANDIMIEYQQSFEEGLDVERYKNLFSEISAISECENKIRLSDILFDIVSEANIRDDYEFIEPSDLDGIKKLQLPYSYQSKTDICIDDKIRGAWYGRICGCFLGKTVEGIRTDELIPFLNETKNYPMHRYILHSDLTDEILKKYKFDFKNKSYADTVDGMPVDDDTNYMILYQEIISKYGKDFTPIDVANAWIKYQSRDAYFTAERVAYCNIIKGFNPPYSAMYKNPYREWIGAQIRGDYFGYINPGNPALAAEMAWRDASVSHIKNGIYGEMYISAMIAAAGETDNINDIIHCGLSQIPYTSRLYKEITSIVNGFTNNVTDKECFSIIHEKYDEYTSHGWCHTIPNAMIVTAALLYGRGDFRKSVCMAVETGFDTDCNGATVGSILGMANGISSIPESFTAPLNDTLYTSIFGFDKLKISDRIELTLKHINE